MQVENSQANAIEAADDGEIIPDEATPWLHVLQVPAIGYSTLLVALALAILVWHQNVGDGPIMAITWAVATLLLVPIIPVDLVTLVIPDEIVLALLGVGLVGTLWAAAAGEVTWWQFAGCIIATVALWVALYVFAIVVGGFGMGDVKLAGALGMLLGTQGVIATVAGAFLLPFVIAAVFVLFVIAFKPTVQGLAFGPYMVGGILVMFLMPGFIVNLGM